MDSRAQFLGHSIHAMSHRISVGLFVTAVVFDVATWIESRAMDAHQLLDDHRRNRGRAPRRGVWIRSIIPRFLAERAQGASGSFTAAVT